MPRSSSLRSALDALASSFTDGILAAIRSASIEDLQAEKGGRSSSGRSGRGAQLPSGGGQPDPLGTPRKKGGRLARRTPEQIARTVDTVVSLVKKSRTGLRAEEIKKALGLDRRELPRVLAQGLKKKALRKKGAKRATTYSAG